VLLGVAALLAVAELLAVVALLAALVAALLLGQHRNQSRHRVTCKTKARAAVSVTMSSRECNNEQP
jgi:hypothetical protein